MPVEFDPWRELIRVFPTIVSLEVGRYVITAGLFSVIIWAFWRVHYAARKIQTREVSAADYRREVFASLRTALIFSVTGFGMYYAHWAGWLTIYEDFSVKGLLYFAATLIAMIIAQDAYFYWTHRAMHHPRLFRTFHWTHHKSKTPTPWTAYAFDAPEAIVMVAFVPLWAAIVPMHDLAIFTFVTWQIVRNVMGHAGVELYPVSGKPSRLFGWWNTTTHHDLHHQNGRSNYGLYFTWWDRWMGTEHPDYQAEVAAFAICPLRRKKPARTGATTTVLAALVLAGGSMAIDAHAQTRSSIAGNWATSGFGSVVRFQPCEGAPQTMCGRIVWLWETNDDEGRPRTDRHNPDRSLRVRSLVGVEIVRGLRETSPNVWSNGALYNPDDGRTYTGQDYSARQYPRIARLRPKCLLSDPDLAKAASRVRSGSEPAPMSPRRFSLYLPLVLHLIPTLAVGYFIVIPQSCIAGVNELTIGFAAANLGFVLAYVAGVKLALKRSVSHA